jgi:hypothetical protein
MPRSILSRASTENFTSLAAIFGNSNPEGLLGHLSWVAFFVGT